MEKQIRLQKIADELSKGSTEVTQQQIDDFLKTNADQLPKGASKEELQSLAKNELTKEASNAAISTWLSNLKKNATIIYR